MTPRENKEKLMDIGKNVADLVKELHEQYPQVKERSLRAMIDDMIWCRDYYPRYAMYLNTKYGFKFKSPDHKRPAKQMLRAA